MESIVIAGCVILEGDQLVTLERISPNWYELPGGKQEPGESLEQTAMREGIEELGSRIQIIGYLGGSHFYYDRMDITSHWYQARIQEAPRVMEPQKFSSLARIQLRLRQDHAISPNLHCFLQEIERGTIKLK